MDVSHNSRPIHVVRPILVLLRFYFGCFGGFGTQIHHLPFSTSKVALLCFKGKMSNFETKML